MSHKSATLKHVREAAVRKDAGAKEALLDRAFAFAFRGLVYPQIWEDPVVDMEALAITRESRIVTILSGGCNALSYLTADPAAVIAVDLNTSHVALGQLKLAALRHLPDYDRFRRFFVAADDPENVASYRSFVRPHLDETSQRYWEGRDLIGRRRIAGFTRGFYRSGLLGGFIGAAHALARVHGVNPNELLDSTDMDEQRRIFEERLAPIFERKIVRWLVRQPASLFGLGIPPAQFTSLSDGNADQMASVLRARLERLACGFPLSDNYFAWQAFGRGYGRDAAAPLPPYLQPQGYEAIRDRANRLRILHRNLSQFLEQQPAGSFDRYVLLDAQDWMTDGQITTLWTQITRTARSGARVLFRTAGEASLLPGRLPQGLLRQWTYQDAASRDLTARDRSAIYGGVHLYTLGG